MASGLTRPMPLSRNSLMDLAGKAKAGKADLRTYGKAQMTKQAGVQPASGSKLRKS